MKSIKKALLALALIAPLAGQAADFKPGFYGVASAGTTEIKYTSNVTLEGNGYGIGVGYEFNRYLAAEVMIGSLFHYAETYVSGGTTYNNSYTINGTAIRGIAKYPMGSVSPFISIGSLSANESLTTTNYGSVQGQGSLTTFGVGTEIALTKELSGRLMIENADSKDTEGATTIHIGLMTRF